MFWFTLSNTRCALDLIKDILQTYTFALVPVMHFSFEHPVVCGVLFCSVLTLQQGLLCANNIAILRVILQHSNVYIRKELYSTAH